MFTFTQRELVYLIVSAAGSAYLGNAVYFLSEDIDLKTIPPLVQETQDAKKPMSTWPRAIWFSGRVTVAVILSVITSLHFLPEFRRGLFGFPTAVPLQFMAGLLAPELLSRIVQIGKKILRTSI